jgi:MFS family permease
VARGQGGVLAPLKERNFAYLWTGMAVSLVGDGVLLVALAWQVYGLSNSPSAMAGVGIAMTVPHVAFLLVGGVASDRFDRRTVMILSDAVRGTAVGLLGLLTVTGTLHLWYVFPLVALYGAATAFFGPAFDALVPDVVPPEHLTQANAIEQFVRPAGHSLAGPALGGLLLATAGSGPAFLVDAATFAVSIACLLQVRPRGPAADPEPAGDGLLSDVKEGFRFVRGNAWLWATFLAATFAYLLFTGPVEVLLPYLVKNDLQAGPGTLGMLLAVGGVGGLAASLVMGWLGAPRRCITFIYVAWTASTFVLVGYGLASAAWQAMVVSVVFNALEAAGTVVWLTTKQRFVPRALLGRISSFDWFISTGLVPLSFAVVAPLAAAIGAANTFLVAGVLGSAVTLAFLFVPGVRSVEDPALSGPGDTVAVLLGPSGPLSGVAGPETVSAQRAPAAGDTGNRAAAGAGRPRR